MSDSDGFNSLAKLALDMNSLWNQSSDAIWRHLDSRLWELTHNPWAVLQTVSREQIDRMFNDAGFKKLVEDQISAKAKELDSPAWFQTDHSNSPLSCVAYFSMEYMLSEALPIYSGGLGNVAGDQLKTASDLGVPVVAIGLLYQTGYFRQVIDRNGEQQALNPYNDPGQLPITPLRQANGEWLRLEIALPGYSVWLRTWQVQVGRAKLYLLDSNDLANFPAHRGITSELYGGGTELRLKQEILLGIAGWRLLQALGLKPEVCHLNEGHAAFAILERARSWMQEFSQPFDLALAVTRGGNIFTTHTAVSAGFDRFSPDLVEQYLGSYAKDQLGISFDDLMALGRRNPKDPSESFNMAYLALRGSSAVNGVSRLHGQVSRHLFTPLFERWPENEVPIGYVTNGVHTASWESAEADALWTNTCGKERWLGTTKPAEKEIHRASDADLWNLRTGARKTFVEYIRKQNSAQLAVSGAQAERIERAKHLFDPNTLTIGFARRFATYKRPNLLLHDPERLLRLLNNHDRPMQLVVAGKAHPADVAGRELIKKWTHFIAHREAEARVVFLSDYDMLLSEHLVQGVDLWVNTPRRPWEACGTSGMKILVNGGLNLSELDGWWAEAYAPDLGWAIGDQKERGEDLGWDAFEANALYDLLEQQVVPEFYTRGEGGIPAAWVRRMRESMVRLTPQFSANRTVREYTEKYYIPAAERFRKRGADNSSLGRQLLHRSQELNQHWASLNFGKFQFQTRENKHLFDAQVHLGGLDPNAVKVELYAEGIKGGEPVYIEMKQVAQAGKSNGATNEFTMYSVGVPADRPAADYTARVIARGDSVPLEAPQILWQR